MNNTDIIAKITAAITAANSRNDKYAGIAASRGNGCASPHLITCDDLQDVIYEVEDGDPWEVVEDEIELADVIGDAVGLGVEADAVKMWTVLVRVHGGAFVTPSDPREYVVVWSY